MTPKDDFFRDYGILPHGEVEPPQMVRCYLEWGDVIGHYVGTGVLSALVIYIALILVVVQKHKKRVRKLPHRVAKKCSFLKNPKNQEKK